MAFNKIDLENIKSKIPISSELEKKTKIVKKGKDVWCCCPFHNEKTPSFTVSPDKGFYHCFGCGAHGDHVGFVMNHDGQTFIESVETLAVQAGLDMPKADPDAARKAERAKGLKEAMVAAVTAYQEALQRPEAEIARAYIDKRGLTPATVEHDNVSWLSPTTLQVVL